jgi:heat shock protein HslJ
MAALGILLICACAGTRIDGKPVTPQNLNAIAGIEWQLKQMTKNNKTIALVKDSQTTFACDKDGGVAGKATINRYSGNLKLQHDGEIIWSKAFMMTRMAGPPELMQQEADFTQALMQTSRVFLKDLKLVLKSDDESTILEFESANK